jgi:energy-coupling factor transporter ATP-binding protein EcfA2
LGKKDKEYLIPLPAQRDVKEIHFNNFDTIDELLAQEKENYLILIWEGERYFTAEEHIHLRNSHSYILRIESRPTIAHKSYDSTQIEKIQDLSTKELFQEYFQYKYQGQLPPEDLLSILGECLDEEPSRDSLERKRGFLPKSLKIQGFYSYKKEVEVDFSLLEEKGFFGIFGNTGSGKSALIEAMIIALYYKVERFGTFGSGGKGNFSNSYGIMNLDSNELLIEFIFEIIGVDGVEEYLCRVSATRDKKKHTEVKIKREVFLKEQEEWIPSEISLGEDIVGITYDDFRKTIILQQRDFLGFISSAPKENTETLMRLFQLERFDLYYTVDRLGQKEFNEFKTLEVKLQNFEDTTDEALEELNTQKTSLELERIALDDRIETQRTLVTKLTQQLEQQQIYKTNKETIQKHSVMHFVYTRIHTLTHSGANKQANRISYRMYKYNHSTH